MGAIVAGRAVVSGLPAVRGRLTRHAPLAPLVWFKAGGAAEWLFEPADAAALAAVLADELRAGDQVICLGAGDITKWAAGLAAAIGERA